MKLKHLLACVVLIMACATAFSQNYSMQGIRNTVKDWNSLKGCAMGESRGCVAWAFTNAYSYVNLADNGLNNILKEINNAKQSIDYISMADNGNYVVVSNGGNKWHALGPQSFYNALNEIMNNGGIRSASVDSNNHYFIVGKNGNIRTDVDEWRNFYNHEKARLGQAKSAWTNTSVLIICFERGVSYYGYIPFNVSQKLKELTFVPDMVQVGKCGNYVFACNNGRAWYQFSDYGRYDSTSTVYQFPGSNSNNNNGGNSAPAIIAQPYMPQTYPCSVCGQTGRCLQCGGSGLSPNHAPGIIAKCGYCGGTGKCGTCGGRGYN